MINVSCFVHGECLCLCLCVCVLESDQANLVCRKTFYVVVSVVFVLAATKPRVSSTTTKVMIIKIYLVREKESQRLFKYCPRENERRRML